jgi:hypothetical protein
MYEKRIRQTNAKVADEVAEQIANLLLEGWRRGR